MAMRIVRILREQRCCLGGEFVVSMLVLHIYWKHYGPTAFTRMGKCDTKGNDRIPLIRQGER